MTSRPSTAAPILAGLAVVLVTLGVYVGAYLWRGQVTPSPGRTRLRVFHSYAEWSLFWPAMYVEGAWNDVSLFGEYPDADRSVTKRIYDATRPSDFAGDP